MKTAKKALSLLLALFLLLSVPTLARAEELPKDPGFDTALSAIRGLVEKNMGSTFNIVTVGRLVIFSNWPDNISDMVEASRDNPALLEKWKTVQESMVTLQQTMQETFDTLASEKRIVMVNIVSDKDHNEVYLTVCEGAVLFDELLGIGLRDYTG